jgi:hypothetical protein
MRRALLITSVAIAAVLAFVIARGMSSGTNIDKRQKYWEKEIPPALKAGATKEELQAFASSHGQALRCYQNYKREDQCSFDDNQSLGGTRNLPMRLAVVFAMKDSKVTSQEFGITPANKQD